MLLRLGACLAATLFAFSTTPTPAQEVESDLSKAPSRFAQLDDMKVHYKSLGQGTTALVLVHGWSCDLSFWKEQVSDLNGKIHLVFIDLPGHGKSDRPKTDYTMDLFAKAIDAVLTEAKVADAVLAGHSMGTPVIRQYYRLYPKKTKALIAVDGAFKTFTADPEVMKKFVARFEGEGFKKAVGAFVDGMFSKQAQKEVVDFVRHKMLSASQHVAVSAMRNMLDAKIWQEDKIEVPVQCLMAKSALWNEDYEKFVRRLAPKVDYRQMEDVGHFLMLEDPPVFNSHLLGFLKKQGFVK